MDIEELKKIEEVSFFNDKNKECELFTSTIDIVRINSTELSTEHEYKNRLEDIDTFFFNLRFALDVNSNIQKWEHKDIYAFKNEEFLINKEDLILLIDEYINKPFMHNKKLSYILTDILLFIEAYTFRKNTLALIKMNEDETLKKIFKFLFKFIKYIMMFFILLLSYNYDKYVFLLIGISFILYIFELRKNKKDVNFELINVNKLLNIYQHSDDRGYSAYVIYELCIDIRKSGTFFDGILFDLLKIQMK